MRNRRLTLFLIFCFVSFMLFGQEHHHHCGSDFHRHMMEKEHPQLRNEHQVLEKKIHQFLEMKAAKTAEEEEIITIPVVVHVVHTNTSGLVGGLNNDNISDDQIYSQIAVLNEDFRRTNADTTNTPDTYKEIAADTRIEFCLATRDPEGNETTGITRHYTQQQSYSYGSTADNQNLKAFGYWPSDSYLNIWVTNVSGSVIGWAQFPGLTGQTGMTGAEGDAETDGVVMDHIYFGDNTGTATGITNPYRFGRSCSHEVGHWLGLFHPWGESQLDGCIPDDYVDDTPRQETSTSGCPVTAPISCSSEDMYQNYMDYTHDRCMNLFTQGQKDRMRAVLAISPRRNALLSSVGCCGASGGHEAPYAYDFESEHFTNDGWSFTATDTTQHWTAGAGFDDSQGVEARLSSTSDSSIIVLYSPEISLKNTSSGIYRFDVAYQNTLSELDSFVVQYETSCLENWTTVFSLSGSDLEALATTNISLENTDWMQVELTLPDQVLGNSAVRFRFVAMQQDGGNFSLDNFEIIPETDELEVEAYPNPSSGEVCLYQTFRGTQDIDILVYDAYGQQQLTQTLNDQVSGTICLDLERLESSVYFVRVVVDDYISTERIVVNKYED